MKFGLGGSAPNYYLPQVHGQLGRLSGDWMYLNITDLSYYGISGELDFMRIKKVAQQYPTSLFCKFGFNSAELDRPMQLWAYQEQYFALLGVKRKRMNSRAQLSLALGGSYSYTIQDSPGLYNSEVSQEKYRPYGEVSFTYSIFKTKEKQDRLVYTKDDFMTKGLPKIKHFFRQYCNPYWSNGIGLDRALITPAGGLKIGRVNTKLSLYSDFTASGIGTTAIDVDLKKLRDKNPKYSRYLSAGISSYSYNVADGGADGHLGLYMLNGGIRLYKNEGRSSWHFHAGIVLSESSDQFLNQQLFSSRNYDYGILPAVGMSYDLYMFKSPKS